MIPIPRTRVKICGITRPEDGLMGSALGADAIGLVFYRPSPRCVDVETAQRIVAVLPPFITVVGLFVNPEPVAVRAVLEVPMGAGADVRDYEQRFANATSLLLDSHGGQKMGGTGQSFDWARIPAERQKPLILAGGLHPGNVTEAIRQVRPYAVDVSSGVESAKGVKDAALMRAFLRGVYDCESHA